MKMKLIQINVTDEDIKKGEPCDPFACPIALAMNRAGFEDVGVYPEWIEFADGRDVDTTFDIFNFVTRFDNYRPVEPRTFSLEIPD